MLDITHLPSELNSYGGSELKSCYYIDEKKYMVKFPDPVQEKNRNISYINNQFSEFIGCHIFQTFDIPTQETILVKAVVNGKEKIAVACQDFLNDSEDLLEMDTISLSLSTEKKIWSNF